MPKIHTILSGKGGVGKSFVAALLAQYLIEKGLKAKCIDTDPLNATFHRYKLLTVERLEIMDGQSIDQRCFDQLIEYIADSNDDVIIDNGASSFISLCEYILENDIPNLLIDMNHEMVVHSIITGGQCLLDTMNGLSELITHFPPHVQFVVWLNPFLGPIELENKSFFEMKVYSDNKERLSKIIQLPKFNQATFGHDLTHLTKEYLTFAESINSSLTNIMTRQRLKMIRTQMFEQIDRAEVI